jgi:hypothetical protein
MPDRPTLGDLIRATKGTDLTYFDLEARMPVDERTGRHSPGWKRLQQIVREGLVVFPDPSTIKALAAGLGYTEQSIIDACC